MLHIVTAATNGWIEKAFDELGRDNVLGGLSTHYRVNNIEERLGYL